MDIKQSIESALRLYQSGDFQQARLICSEVLKEQPENEEVLYLFGIASAGLEDYDDAVLHLDSVLRLNPANADACLALGAIFQKKGLDAEAVEYCRKAIAIDPDFGEAHENLGDIFTRMHRYDEAIAHYKKALHYFPESAEIYCSLGRIFKMRGQYDLAAYYHRKALLYEPECTEALNSLGAISLGQGRLDEAITLFRKALKIDPGLEGARTNLGHALDEKRQLEDAVIRYKDWLGFSVRIGSTKVEMLINSIINQFYFRALGVQFHPDAGYGNDARDGVKRQILAGIIRKVNRTTDVGDFFSGLGRLYEIRDCFEDPEYLKNLQKKGRTDAAKPAEIAALERLHQEFMSIVSKLETELVSILSSPFDGH